MLLPVALAFLSSLAGAAPPVVPTPILGVTVDDVGDLAGILAALEKLPRKPTVRVVFDEGVPARRYVEAVRAIHAKAYVMGQLVDSMAVKDYEVDAYRRRAIEYVDLLGKDVDVWEIGNELNGEWLGAQAADKASQAFDAVKARGGRTALTLFYNQGCWENPENEMFRWTAAHVAERLRSGVDYALISYYEDECHGLRPDWTKVFARLGRLFPTARLGFGEVGTTDAAHKAEMLRRFYAMPPPSPRFVGGYFWWFFKQDMVPAGKPLFKVLAEVSAEPMRGQPVARPRQ